MIEFIPLGISLVALALAIYGYFKAVRTEKICQTNRERSRPSISEIIKRRQNVPGVEVFDPRGGDNA